MSTTTLARPPEGTPTRSIAVDARRRDLLATPAPSDREAQIVLQWHAWGYRVPDGLLSCFGAGQPQPALAAPEHIAPPPVTELAVSVPLRDMAIPDMETRAIARPSTEWTRWRRFVRRVLSLPDRGSALAFGFVGAGALVLLSVETHPWRFLAALVARMDLGTVIALAFLAGPAVGAVLGLGAVLMAPRRSA